MTETHTLCPSTHPHIRPPLTVNMSPCLRFIRSKNLEASFPNSSACPNHGISPLSKGGSFLDLKWQITTTGWNHPFVSIIMMETMYGEIPSEVCQWCRWVISNNPNWRWGYFYINSTTIPLKFTCHRTLWAFIPPILLQEIIYCSSVTDVLRINQAGSKPVESQHSSEMEPDRTHLDLCVRRK